VANAQVLAEALTADGLHLVTGGTDNHMMLVDLRPQDITGRDAERLLGAAGITVNKNSVPFEARGPMVTSGIRIGTPAVTSRGMGPEEMRQIAAWIVAVLQQADRPQAAARVARQVRDLCRSFPLYGGAPAREVPAA
jgi:glycine hydroxymethyltransferase